MTEPDFLAAVLKGNAAAVDLCLQLGVVSQAWDDLVDRDVPMPPAAVHAAFMAALIDIPSNPFFQEHAHTLLPVLRTAAYDYIASVQLEAGDAHDRTLAFVLRDSLVAIVVLCASLIGGHAWAIQCTAEIRRHFHNETLSEFNGG